VQLQQLVQSGLKQTEALWPSIEQAYEWLHQAAHILGNEQQANVATLKEEYEQLLERMKHEQNQAEKLAGWVEPFCKVTASYWKGLFACYEVKDLPRTNNGLEQYFGAARHAERRVTGRKQASPALVVRGSVRVVAAGASRLLTVTAAQLRLTDVHAWRALRQQLHYRHEARRMQLRFRRNPQAYLAALEQRLITTSLPS
jgi:hypothetical protein